MLNQRSSMPRQNVVSEKSVSDCLWRTHSTAAARRMFAFQPIVGSRGGIRRGLPKKFPRWRPPSNKNMAGKLNNDARRETKLHSEAAGGGACCHGLAFGVLHTRPAFHNVCVSVHHQLRRVGLMCVSTVGE
jgi:hypothetical protein